MLASWPVRTTTVLLGEFVNPTVVLRKEDT